MMISTVVTTGQSNTRDSGHTTCTHNRANNGATCAMQLQSIQHTSSINIPYHNTIKHMQHKHPTVTLQTQSRQDTPTQQHNNNQTNITQCSNAAAQTHQSLQPCNCRDCMLHVCSTMCVCSTTDTTMLIQHTGTTLQATANTHSCPAWTPIAV